MTGVGQYKVCQAKILLNSILPSDKYFERRIERVPVVSDLPILGYLFRYKSKTTARTELLIFITPSILKD
ncbi:MAG: type II and III secretion system protein [Elusimicrobia bacterium]|nr:type II and III secretion system protein [Elusimicrobiota bacterium]MBU2615067.1 type II and III secretion system protein [Elusimicrobiota bacterium]